MPFFSKRVSMLEVQNRALIKAARETAERIDKLERELRNEHERQQAAQESAEHIGRLERELQQARERVLDSLERELQQVNRELERLKAEREFYFKRVEELEEHNRALTESATKYSLLGQKLERELARIDPNGAPRRRFGAQCEE
jgi:chromosome segregation ATPase